MGRPLRVVQTQAILFLKSMSELDGSDIERLWNLLSKSSKNRLETKSIIFRVVSSRIRLFPTLISKIKWVGSGLPLKIKVLKFLGSKPRHKRTTSLGHMIWLTSYRVDQISNQYFSGACQTLHWNAPILGQLFRQHQFPFWKTIILNRNYQLFWCMWSTVTK